MITWTSVFACWPTDIAYHHKIYHREVASSQLATLPLRVQPTFENCQSFRRQLSLVRTHNMVSSPRSFPYVSSNSPKLYRCTVEHLKPVYQVKRHGPRRTHLAFPIRKICWFVLYSYETYCLRVASAVGCQRVSSDCSSPRIHGIAYAKSHNINGLCLLTLSATMIHISITWPQAFRSRSPYQFHVVVYRAHCSAMRANIGDN